MKTGRWLTIAALVTLASGLKTAAQDRPIRAEDFPRMAVRVHGFEKLMNSPRVEDREQVVRELADTWRLPDEDLVKFFRHIARHDAAPEVRGSAILALYDHWVPIDPKDLPATFSGYLRTQLVNRQDPDLAKRLIREVRQGGLTGGYAAYVAGLLRIKEAVPGLHNLAEDNNVFVRYTGARALIDCGDPKGAEPILKTVMSNPIPPRAPIGTIVDPHYQALAARAYAGLGKAQRQAGIERLIDLMKELAAWEDVNAEGRLLTARAMLGNLTGQLFLTHQEARAWYEKNK
jgi:hypothetical protein